jgi:hypothetical protein
MKRCPACHRTYESSMAICPDDGVLLEEIDPASVQVPAAETRGKRRIDTGELVNTMLEALEGKREHEREVVLSNMHHLQKYNMYCHAIWRFLQDLTDTSDRFNYEIRQMDEGARMWVTFTLVVGDGKYLRKFPIRANYDRALGHDVTLEIDVEDIGTNRDERIARTEEVGGRASNTRFGWSYLIRAPRAIEDESELLEWIRATFRSIFILTYSVD